MNKTSATALLVAVSLLTAVAATVGASPLAWLLVYAGWLLLARYCGSAMLAELRSQQDRDPQPRAAQRQEPVPVRIPVRRPHDHRG